MSQSDNGWCKAETLSFKNEDKNPWGNPKT